MATGDLIHPKEDSNAAEQATIVLDHATRWYTAHLLLFIGMILFIPGVLGLTNLASARRPGVAHAARLLALMGLAGFAAIIAFEMLLGQYARNGAEAASAAALIDAFQSGPVFGALAPAALAFFAGTGLLVFVLAAPADTYRWPAILLAIGLVLILVEIVSSVVLFSQVGNVVALAASTAFAALIWRRVETVA